MNLFALRQNPTPTPTTTTAPNEPSEPTNIMPTLEQMFAGCTVNDPEKIGSEAKRS